jgi:hypothetical protein
MKATTLQKRISKIATDIEVVKLNHVNEYIKFIINGKLCIASYSANDLVIDSFSIEKGYDNDNQQSRRSFYYNLKSLLKAVNS